MGATQMPVSGAEIVVIGVIVAIVILLSATWELVQHFEVMAHEGMHWVVGSLTGRTVEWVELESNGDGGTRVVPDSGLGFLAAAFVGYLGPSAFGLGAAGLIHFGHIIAVLWIAILLLGLLLTKLRRSFGHVTVPLAGLAIFLILKHTSQSGEILAAYVITWFLLLSGVRVVVQHGVMAVDADILSSRTRIPRLVWFALWLGGTLTAVLIGARWMLHPAVLPPGLGAWSLTG